MYCPFCGCQWPTLLKFCSSCGRNVSFVVENAHKPAGEDQVSCQTVPRVTDACAVPVKSASAVLQFMKYRELKETERKTFSKSKKKSNKPVKISVGIMNKTKNGLRSMRGKNLPLHVDPQWSSEQLLAAALKKQKDFNQDIEDGEYVLLYPDGSQIKNIPGTDTPFTIGEYKEAIGKAYQRITLYICTLEDLLSKSQDDSVSEEDEVFIRAQPNMSPLSDTVLWSSPDGSTPERRHGSATTSAPSTSQSSNGQSATIPKQTTTRVGELKSNDFYSVYTHIYAPITIDSSSSDFEEVEKLLEKDRKMDEKCVSDTIQSGCNSGSEQRSVMLVCEGHGDQILSVLCTFRNKGMLFDFHIHVEDEILPCHRSVIAACSDFFRAMFEVNMLEHDSGSVTLHNLSAQAVSSFLDFAYLGQIKIMEENVEMLFHLASFLQVSSLLQACGDFLLQTLDLSNCLHLLAIAEGYGSSCLLHDATEFVMSNFYALSSRPDFLEMPLEILRHCLASDSLNVPDELSALQSLILWTQHDLQLRCSLFPELLSHIRLHHLPPAKLKELGHSEALILNSDDCSRAVMKALALAEDFSGFLPDARPSTLSSYIFVHKTDENSKTRHTFCYSVADNYWHQLPSSKLVDLPGSSITSFGEKLFVIGGCRGKCCRTVRLHIAGPKHEATKEAWCYCPVTGQFLAIEPMQYPRTMHVSVTALHHIYVIGGKGLEMHGLLDVECYDPLENTWKFVSPLPRRIYYPETAVCGTIIYTLGSGLETSDSFNPLLDSFFRYDAEANQWCQMVQEFGQLFHATLVKAVSNKTTLYLCDLSTYKVYRFLPDTCVWKNTGSFECAGFNAGAICVQEKMYILGGDYSPDEITDDVQVYNISQNRWQEVAPMPCALTEFHCQVIRFNRYRDPLRAKPATMQKNKL